MPGRGEEQDQVDRESGRREGDGSDAGERAEPDGDLGQRHHDPGENGHVDGDREQGSDRAAVGERLELRPDVIRGALVEEVRIRQLLDPGVEERHAQESPKHPEGPGHLLPASGDGDDAARRGAANQRIHPHEYRCCRACARHIFLELV